MNVLMIKILHDSAAIQTVLGGLSIHRVRKKEATVL